MIPQLDRRKKSLAIAIALFLLCNILHFCANAQVLAKHYQVYAICFKESCKDIKIGSIAITPREIHITTDGIRTTYKILHYFYYKHKDHYRIEGKDFDGWFVIGDHYATIELYDVVVQYMLKPYER
jgi:hypothetical protein